MTMHMRFLLVPHHCPFHLSQRSQIAPVSIDSQNNLLGDEIKGNGRFVDIDLDLQAIGFGLRTILCRRRRFSSLESGTLNDE